MPVCWDAGMLGRWEAKQVGDLKILFRLQNGFRASASRKTRYPPKKKQPPRVRWLKILKGYYQITGLSYRRAFGPSNLRMFSAFRFDGKLDTVLPTGVVCTLLEHHL